MADTYTANLSLIKPEVGASADTWGVKLNDNADDLDALFTTGPALSVAAGGTGGVTASAARTNLGLGTIATQDASAVAITGGTAYFSTLYLSGATPIIWSYESGAGNDEKYWRWVAASGNYYLQAMDDAASAGSSPVAVSRTGTVVDSIAFTATTVTVNGNVAYHAGNVSGASIAETQIADGTVLARVGSNETVSGTWNFTATPTISGSSVLSSISAVAESQITDSTILARVGSNETVTGTWSYTATPAKTGGGKFLHYASSGNSGGSVTVDTAAASGVPADGDLWIQYTA